MFTFEEHTAKINAIIAAENEVERKKLLLELSDDYKQVTTDFKVLSDNNAQLTKDNTEYAKLNNSLMLRLGGESLSLEQISQNQGEENNGGQPPEKLTFESLESQFE